MDPLCVAKQRWEEQMSSWILTPARIVRHPLLLSALARVFVQLPVLTDEGTTRITVLGSATAVGAAWGTRKNCDARARVRKNLRLFISVYLRRPDRGVRLNAASRRVLDAVRGLPADDPAVVSAKAKAVDLGEIGYIMDSGEPWFADKYIAEYAHWGFWTGVLLYPLALLYMRELTKQPVVASSPLSPLSPYA